MAEQKKKAQVPPSISPIGTAKWAKLTTPDTKFNEAGVYSVELILDPKVEANIVFIQKIQAAHDAAYDAAVAAEPKKTFIKNPVKIKPETKKVKVEGTEDETILVETGMTQVSFACKASGVRKKDKTKWTFKPGLFDAKRVPLPKDVVIFSGSIIKVSYHISHVAMPTGQFYTALKLFGVQVLSLKSMSNRDASEYGFVEETEYAGVEYTDDGGVPPTDAVLEEMAKSAAAAGVAGGDDF